MASQALLLDALRMGLALAGRLSARLALALLIRLLWASNLEAQEAQEAQAPSLLDTDRNVVEHGLLMSTKYTVQYICFTCFYYIYMLLHTFDIELAFMYAHDDHDVCNYIEEAFVAEQETVEFALCGSRKIPRTSEIWINKICKMHSTSQYYVSSLQSRNQLPRSTKYSNLQLPPRSSLLLYMALHGNIFGLSCMNVHEYAWHE